MPQNTGETLAALWNCKPRQLAAFNQLDAADPTFQQLTGTALRKLSSERQHTLRLRDVNLPAQVLTVSVEGSKNRYRHRTIPLRETSTLWAMEQLIKRAWEMGAREPDHYIFPFCSGHVTNPNKPMTVQGLKRPWQEVREATGLLSFRMYDTRHTAITRLAEEGVPITVIMSLAGHISPRMTLHYTHVSDQGKIIAMRKANQSRFGAAENVVPSPIASVLPVTRSASALSPSAGPQLVSAQQPRTVASHSPQSTAVQPAWRQSTTFLRGRPFGF
jgi:hypothetical protein